MSWISKFRLPYRNETAFGLIALAVFIIPLAFSVFAYENFESVKFSLFLLCTGAAAVAFFRKFAAGKATLAGQKVFYYLLGAFGLWAILASIFSIDPFYSVFGFYYRFTNGLVFVASFLLFLLLVMALTDLPRLLYLMNILVFDALAVAIVAFVQSFNILFYGGLNVGGLFRGPSLLGNTDYSAMFLACVFPLVLYFFSQAKSFKAKIYYAVVAFSIIAANFILGSRAALLAMAVSLIFAIILLLLYRFPKKFFLGLLGTCLITGIFGQVLLSVSRPGAISSIVGPAVDSNASLRLSAWKVSLLGIAQHPWLGAGLGAYELFFEHSRPADIAGQLGVFDDAHNLYLQMADTGGLPWLFLFLAVIAIAAWYGFLALRREKDIFSLFLLSSLVCWLVAVSFNPVPIPMFLVLALLLGGLVMQGARSGRLTASLAWGRGLVLLGIVLFIFGALSFVSEHLLGLAIRAYADQKYDSSYRLSSVAYDLNPTNELFLWYKAGSEINLGKNKIMVESDIKKIENLHPKQAESFVLASSLYSLLFNDGGKRTDLQAAADSLRQALVLDPFFAERYGQLALYEYQLNNLPEAKALVLRDLGLENSDFSGWILLAKLYQTENNRVATINALQQALELQPENPRLKYVLQTANSEKDIKKVPLEIGARQAAP